MLQAEDISSILPAMTTKGEIVLYQPNDQLKIEVRLDNENRVAYAAANGYIV